MEPTDLDLLLVDARHLLWRAASVFFDLHAERAGKTIPTGGIYGWLRIAMSTKWRFGGMVVACWDLQQGPVHRRALFPEYKNKPKSAPKRRDKKPAPTRYAADGISGEYNASDRASAATVERDVLLMQMAEQEIILKKLLTILGVRQASSPGWEADDVIATLCRHYNGKAAVGILSGDRDLIQLVNQTTSLIRPQPKGQFEVLTPDKVQEDFGLSPVQILDLKALSGDNSDNIPGAKGIGPVTATKLIQEHKTWQQALTWAATAPTTSKLAQKLTASRAMVEVSAKLATLNHRAPLEFIDPAKDGKAAMIEIASLKFNSLMADGRREQLMGMGE